MNTDTALSSLNVGDTSTIQAIHSTGAMRRRLLDLGFCEGSPIKCVQLSPAGDPVAYMIRGTIIALRNEDAKHIIVKKGGQSWD